MLMGLLYLIAGGQRKGKVEEHVLKAINYYLLVSLTLLEYSNQHDLTTEFSFASIGFSLLFLYLMGKLEQRKVVVQINKQFQRFSSQINPKVERLFIIAALVFFIVGIFLPQLTENPVNLWFYDTIKSIYETPLIGWIIKIVGLFFTINMIIRGLVFVRKVINGILGRENHDRSQNPFDQNGSTFTQQDEHNYDGEYVDFEEVDDN